MYRKGHTKFCFVCLCLCSRLSSREPSATWFKSTDFRVSCVKILVNPKGLTAFYALPTQKSVCFKLLAPKAVSARMNFCF